MLWEPNIKVSFVTSPTSVCSLSWKKVSTDLVHVSDLSWTKKIKHPSEFVKVGETMEVQVLELDAANRRLALSHKHMEENPWDTFENIFTIGSVHKCTIINKNDKGAILELPYGIEGFCAAKNLRKKTTPRLKLANRLTSKCLSSLKTTEELCYRTRQCGQQKKKTSSSCQEESPFHKRSRFRSINQQTEKSTLGDLEALSALKEKMSGGGGEPKAE